MLKRNQIRLGLIAILALTNYLIWTAGSLASTDDLRIDFLNVGQGDAALIRTPSGENILVDGGPDNSVLAELGKLLPVWDRTLDLVVATHPEADHISGLIAVMERYTVKEILTLNTTRDTQVGKVWQQLITTGPQVNFADAADDYIWDEVVWDTLSPIADINFAYIGNDQAVVAQVSYRDYQILFTGDIATTKETELQQIYPALRADVIKIAHHGSKYSTGTAWLAQIQPKVAVIEVGKNSYGHPAVDALTRIKAAGTEVYRTDQDGTIEMIFEDSGYWIKAHGQKKFYQK